MARRATTAKSDTDTHDEVTGQVPSAPPPVAPFPVAWGHPDAVYCADCGRTAIGRMKHGPHTEKKK